MHPNPLLYKYYWWVLAKSDLPEDMIPQKNMLEVSNYKRYRSERKAYIKKNFGRMCTHHAMAYMKELEDRNQTYEIYNEQLPRKGPSSPFDPTKEKWQGCEWAPPFDEDTDLVWNGYK